MSIHILCLLASPSREHSVSRSISDDLLMRLSRENPDATRVIRDLAIQPPPHWGASEYEAALKSPKERSESDLQALKTSDELCAELCKAEIVVIATPMWNFSVPSSLKAWIDHVVRAGITFQYGSSGPVGLLTGLKTVYIIEATGARYLEPPAQALNHVAPYLTHVFQFLGAKQIRTITAPATAMDRRQALRDAQAELQRLFKEH